LKRDIVPIIVISALKGLTDTLKDIEEKNIKDDAEKKDLILAQGELLSANILHRILETKGLETVYFEPDDDRFPIILESYDGYREIDFRKTQDSLVGGVKNLVDRKIIPIIPGFVGKTEEGKIKTLERGGSDTTAVVLGTALQISKVFLLKDVPGILRCDPEIGNSKKILNEVDVARAIQLGKNGSEVINPHALAYKRKNTEIRIVNYDNSEFFNEGTRITGELEILEKIDISNRISLVSLLTNDGKIELNRYLDLLNENNLEYISRFESNGSYSLCVPENESDEIIDLWHREIRRRDDDIFIGLEDDLSLLEIQFNCVPEISRYIYKIQKKMIDDSVKVLYSKFDSGRFTAVFKENRLNEIDKVFEAIK